MHTALTFDLVGEDVLITGAGPIGCMAIPICRHAGARNIVITDVNPYRLDLARKMGATLALDVRTEKSADAMTQLGEVVVEHDRVGRRSAHPQTGDDVLRVVERSVVDDPHRQPAHSSTSLGST